jgi:hypothetical protein
MASAVGLDAIREFRRHLKRPQLHRRAWSDAIANSPIHPDQRNTNLPRTEPTVSIVLVCIIGIESRVSPEDAGGCQAIAGRF